ncbi:MAG: hypothetical protein HZC55_22320 [Verrucomicrobia bacterium]|nr:hypothetical protein [Verrucomicrobiota bacterium]
MPSPHFILAAILAAMLVSILLMRVNQQMASPIVLIVDRWLRWFLFAFGSAQICTEYQLIDRPFWVLAIAFFLIWFLLITLYDWAAITAHSLSPLPLFPRYSVNASGDEWPVQPRLLRMREWLRGQGFRQVQALKAEIGGGIYLRTSIYQDAQATLRVQVSFLPQASGAVTVCYAISSITADGSRYLTDNLFIPFGGFYPENWFVDRAPWRRSLPKLIEHHRARLGRAAAEVVPFTNEPLSDLNAVQQELDRLNTELGFLHPHAEREDHGKFTTEGRYRVWKEIWMLNYLGRSARYE